MDKQNFDDLINRLAYLESTIKELRTLVGPFGVLFPDGSMLTQTIYGTKYFIDPSDLIMAPQMIIYRQWESDLSKFMVSSVDKNTYFVDVGANFGYFTCLVASKIGLGGNGAVLSIEPNPKIRALLYKNVQINWSMAPVEIHECAVSENNGYVQFSVPADRAANAGISISNPSKFDTSFIVETKPIDALTNGRSVDIMKIDVEGFETAVLKGAAKTIENSPNIIIVLEWSIAQMKSSGFAPDDLIKVINNLGLNCYRLPSTRFLSKSEWENLYLSRESLLNMPYENIIIKRK